MSVESVVQAVYLVAAVLFVLSLAGLSKQETARRGVLLGMFHHSPADGGER